MEDIIKVGEYLIIQKQNYKKLVKLNNPNTCVTLGRDSINLSGIAGYPFFSVFRMIPNSKRGREYRLELTAEVVELKDEIEVKTSGLDNRNIIDDGQSQKLSAAEIADITNDATKASDIVETLISNSNTFHNKTEYSQEKYLKKKEKKYFEYIQIVKPNLRLISEIMYRLDPGKIQNIRMDTLSQIITMSNIHCEGVHLLYDSGSNGLMSAALLSVIGEKTNGKLLHMHPGNISQKQALLAMNFPEEQSGRCVSVNIYSALRQYYQGNDTHNEKVKTESNPVQDNVANITSEVNQADGKDSGANPLKRKASDNSEEHDNKIPKLDEDTVKGAIETPDSETKTVSTQPEPKKPKWHFDNITASELLTQKVDSLIIACKEDPLAIFEELLPFVKPGRPFVVYYSMAEPLQNMFLEMRSDPRVAALKLTCNWMRNYQVLPERTHPEVMMNNQSGFLLSGYVLK